MSSIPANLFVDVTPSVLAAGGDALELVGLFITENTRVPIGSVLSFPSAASVSTYFGASAAEVTQANLYFAGYTGATAQPGAILFAQYPNVAVAAYLRGGNAGAALTLAQLQALSGSLTVTFDGYARTGSSIVLSSATSFSSAATLIQTGLNSALPNESSFTGAIAATVLTVSVLGSGVLAVGQTVAGSGVTAGTIITALGTGTGGTGTYTVNNSQSVSSEAMTTTATPVAVSYDSVSGGFVVTSGIAGVPSTASVATGTLAVPILLTTATGAVVSQGAAATTPSAFMASIVAITQNWASFKTMFDPDGGSGNAQKLLFAQWTALQNNRYVYVCWDTDITPTASVPATGSLGYLLQQGNYSGTCLIYEPSNLGTAAFVCGAIASINFSEPNGRTDFAFLSQSGLTAGVTDATSFVNLAGNPQVQGSFGNGYNCYAAVATANQLFVNFQRGSVSGPFKWLDSYINQIWFNNALQLAAMVFFTNAKSVPFNSAGQAAIEAALADPINAALAFGAIRTGVTLSASQISEINNAVGSNVAPILQTRGWYLSMPIPAPSIRTSRGPWPAQLFYTDGGSVQSISLGSVEVQ